MKATELITVLAESIAKHGDAEVRMVIGEAVSQPVVQLTRRDYTIRLNDHVVSP